MSKRPPKAQRLQKRQLKNEVIRHVRALVMQRDHCRCRVCAAVLDPEMHEIEPRSKLRGRSPEAIFNTRNCLILCRRCHSLVTRHDINIVAQDAEHGADGIVYAQKTLDKS